jgi:hypothetical protein
VLGYGIGTGPPGAGSDRVFNGLICPTIFRVSFLPLLAVFLALLAIIYSSLLNIRKPRRQQSRTNFRAWTFAAFLLLCNSDAAFVATVNGELRIVPLGYEIPCVGSA